MSKQCLIYPIDEHRKVYTIYGIISETAVFPAVKQLQTCFLLGISESNISNTFSTKKVKLNYPPVMVSAEPSSTNPPRQIMSIFVTS